MKRYKHHLIPRRKIGPVELAQLLLDALLPGLKVMSQVRRQVPLEHLVAHADIIAN